MTENFVHSGNIYTYRYVRAEINFGRTQRYLQLFQPVHSGIYLLFHFALFFDFLNQQIKTFQMSGDH